MLNIVRKTYALDTLAVIFLIFVNGPHFFHPEKVVCMWHKRILIWTQVTDCISYDDNYKSQQCIICIFCF